MEFLTQVDYRLYFSREDFRSWIYYVRNSLIDFISYEISLGSKGCAECRKHEIFSNGSVVTKLSSAKIPGAPDKQRMKSPQYLDHRQCTNNTKPANNSASTYDSCKNPSNRASPMPTFPTPLSSPPTSGDNDGDIRTHPSCSGEFATIRRSACSTSRIDLAAPRIGELKTHVITSIPRLNKK